MELGVNKGLLPRMIDNIFERVNDNTDPDLEYQVYFSILEIYNEKGYDLFKEVDKNQSRKELRIVENEAKNLTCVNVSGPEDVSSILQKGYKNRSIAATKMNQYSSRAHTVATIYLKQIRSKDKTTLSSQINVVDLAGSERVVKTKAEGDRLKEGSNINKSLLYLGNVIRALAEEKAPPTYRDSKLTLLLKSSLGGNSKTVMLATVNPSESNLLETKSTLDYAFQAKSITNKSKANEYKKLNNDEAEDLMRKLHTTKAKLNDVILRKKESDDEIIKLRAEIENLRRKLQEALSENKESLHEQIFTHDERITTVPHLLNLNEDHMLSKLVRYYIEKDKSIYVGGNTTDFPEEQILAVNEIGQIGQVTNRDGKVSLQTFRKNAVAINGKRINTERTEQSLRSGDRLMFGSLRSLWVYVDPTAQEPCLTIDDINYDIAEDEIILESNTNEIIPTDDIALSRKLEERSGDVKVANFKSVLSNKSLKFELALTSAFFLGINKGKNVVIVKVWNRKNNCRYIWTEREFMQTMDDIHAFKINGENDSDPFDIKPDDAFTPVGVSFVFMDDLGNKRTKNQCSDLFDEEYKKIGEIETFFEVKEKVQMAKLKNITICIQSVELDESIKRKYTKVKCSLRLTNRAEANSDEEELEEIETRVSPCEAPYFNFRKEIQLNDASNEKFILRLFGIPRPATDLYIERGDLAELVDILKEKNNTIERLRKERDALKLKVAELEKVIYRRDN
nr:kinesin-like protein unc-104 [Crassostrea gigas]